MNGTRYMRTYIDEKFIPVLRLRNIFYENEQEGQTKKIIIFDGEMDGIYTVGEAVLLPLNVGKKYSIDIAVGDVHDPDDIKDEKNVFIVSEGEMYFANLTFYESEKNNSLDGFTVRFEIIV